MMMTNTMMEPGIPARYSYSASETRDSMGMSMGTTHHPLNLHQRQPNGSSYPSSNGPGSEFGSGNIVYQTPTSAPIPVPSANKRAHTPVPASVLGFEASTFRPPLSLSTLAAASDASNVPSLNTGVSPLLPSFLKQEYDSPVNRSFDHRFAQMRIGGAHSSPISLSPASSSSASLSHEDDAIASPMVGTTATSRFGVIGSRPGSGNGNNIIYGTSASGMMEKKNLTAGNIGAFYTHHASGSSGSSNGSTSSLSLGGNSIWSMCANQTEDNKPWSLVV